MNIYLIGYRCCGKSSLGQWLAKRLGWKFMDTDSKVVMQSGRKIAAIVEENGWKYFRRDPVEFLGQKLLARLGSEIVAPGKRRHAKF